MIARVDPVRGRADAVRVAARRSSAARRARGRSTSRSALSGMTALGAEVIWTRILSLLLRRDGLHVLADPRGVPASASASAAASARRSRATSSVRASRSAWCQLLLCAAMAWTAYMLTRVAAVLADQSVDLDRRRGSRSSSISSRCLWAVLPAAILWGASFPLALASVASRDEDAGAAGRRRLRGQHGRRHRRLARREPVLVAWIGSQHAQQVLIIVVGAVRRCCCSMRRRAKALNAVPARRHAAGSSRWRRGAARAARVHPVPGVLVAYGRYAATRHRPGRHHLRRRGLERVGRRLASCANGVRNYHNAGKVQASSEPQDMRLQRMLGHLTTLDSGRARRRCSSSAAARA